MRIIFLAAGKSNRIFNKIKKNKCLININGKPLIELLIDEIKKTKIPIIPVTNTRNELKNMIVPIINIISLLIQDSRQYFSF